MRVLVRPPRRRAAEDGAAAVEFALIFSLVLVPLLLGMLQYGWYFYASQVTGSAARETARRLTVGDCQGGTSPTKATQFARTQSGFKDLTLSYGPTSNTTSNALPAVGQVVRVTAQSDGAIINFFPLPADGQITRTVDARVEDVVEDSSCS